MGAIRCITKRTWRTVDVQYIRDNWLVQSDTQLAAHFGVSKDALEAFRKKHGMKRPLNTSGLKAPHRKGEAPWNVAKKGKPFLHRVRNRDVWAVVRIGADGTRRVMTLARTVWEDAGRPVPPGHAVYQTHGDRSAPKLEELVCVDRSGLGRIANRCIVTDRSELRRKGRRNELAKQKVRSYVAHQPYQFSR